MPNRKAPTLDKVKLEFLKYPEKKLNDFANEWGITSERVRQLREECGLGPVFKIDYEIVETIAERIENNISTVTSIQMYKDLPIGRDAFATWMRDDIDVAERIHKAQKIAKAKRVDPDSKVCSICKENKLVSEFPKSQKYVDGYHKFCMNCLLEVKQSKPKKLKNRHCLMCKKDKAQSSFDKHTAFCKTCKSKSRRAIRARDLKAK